MEPSRCLVPLWLRLEKERAENEAAFIRAGRDSHRKYQKASEKQRVWRAKGGWGSDTQETEWKGEAEIAKMDLEGGPTTNSVKRKQKKIRAQSRR